MKVFVAAVFASFLAVPAFAQQPQQMSPSQLAIAIDEAVGGLAKTAEQQAALIQAQQARIKELEDKYEKTNKK